MTILLNTVTLLSFFLLKSLFSFEFKEEAIHYKTGKIG